MAFGTEDEFSKLYDYYFPKQGQGVESGYRRYFDKLVFGPPPPASQTNRSSQVYYALRGDDAAFHAFLHNPDWAVEGAQGEECVYESVLLLLRLGDDRFSQLLAREDAKTRKQVGYAIDPQIDWHKHQFPKTRALYSYRYVRASQQEVERQQRVIVATVPTGLTQDEINHLDGALKKEKRFSQVQVVGTNEPGAPGVITAPRSMPKQDRAGLRQFIRDQLGPNRLED